MKTSKLCLSGFVNEDFPQVSSGLIHALNTPVFRPADTGVNRQALNRWDTEGLISDSRKQSNSWRRFSPVEFIWLFVVSELRKTGLPFDQIRLLRQQIFDKVFPKQWKRKGTKGPAKFLRKGFGTMLLTDQEEITKSEGIELLTGLVAQAVVQKSWLTLQVFPGSGYSPQFNGSQSLLSPAELERENQARFISVPLTSFIFNSLLDHKPQIPQTQSQGLSPAQLHILDLVTVPNLQEFKLMFENGQPTTAHTTQILPPDTPLDSIPYSDGQEIKILRSESGASGIKCKNQFYLNPDRTKN